MLMVAAAPDANRLSQPTQHIATQHMGRRGQHRHIARQAHINPCGCCTCPAAEALSAWDMRSFQHDLQFHQSAPLLLVCPCARASRLLETACTESSTSSSCPACCVAVTHVLLLLRCCELMTGKYRRSSQFHQPGPLLLVCLAARASRSSASTRVLLVRCSARASCPPTNGTHLVQAPRPAELPSQHRSGSSCSTAGHSWSLQAHGHTCARPIRGFLIIVDEPV